MTEEITCHNCIEIAQIVDDVREHLKEYPKERDPKYSGHKDQYTQHVVWNMPYFLTDLDVWHKALIKKLKSSPTTGTES